jgi:hypothetical protein
MSKKTVEEYIAELEPWQGEIVAQVRKIVVEAAPEAEESVKWAQPVYEINGPFAYIKAFKKAVNFGFWRGVDIQDTKGLLQGSGDKMRHVKLSSIGDIDHEAFTEFIHQAINLNLQKGDPTKTP